MDPQIRPQAVSIGASDVDGEHEIQISLLAAFIDAIAGGRDREELEEILDRLLDYSKLHFLSEELLMRFYSYSGYEAHVREHEQTVEGIIALRERAFAGDEGLSRADAEALSRGIVAHIRETDRALGHFLVQTRRSQSV